MFVDAAFFFPIRKIWWNYTIFKNFYNFGMKCVYFILFLGKSHWKDLLEDNRVIGDLMACYFFMMSLFVMYRRKYLCTVYNVLWLLTYFQIKLLHKVTDGMDFSLLTCASLSCFPLKVLRTFYIGTCHLSYNSLISFLLTFYFYHDTISIEKRNQKYLLANISILYSLKTPENL